MEASGMDSNGHQFSSAGEMWREEIGEGGEEKEKVVDWYNKGIFYWQNVEASIESVLGVYGCVNDVDVKCSEAFLKTILSLRFGKEKRYLVALDCGLGIGRVTKNLLLRHFNEVDLVEPVSHFLETACENSSQNSDNNMQGEEESYKASNFSSGIYARSM